MRTGWDHGAVCVLVQLLGGQRWKCKKELSSASILKVKLERFLMCWVRGEGMGEKEVSEMASKFLV